MGHEGMREVNGQRFEGEATMATVKIIEFVGVSAKSCMTRWKRH